MAMAMWLWRPLAMAGHNRSQAHRERGIGGVSYPGPCDVWGASPSARNIKYARMRGG